MKAIEAGSVLVSVVAGDGTTNGLNAGLSEGAYVDAMLRGVSFDARGVVRSVNQTLLLPPRQSVHPEVVAVHRGAGFSPLPRLGLEQRWNSPAGVGVGKLKRAEARAPLPTASRYTARQLVGDYQLDNFLLA